MQEGIHSVLFGGSFNPIHMGHVAIVKALLQQKPDHVWVMPTHCSPFKTKLGHLPDEVRLQMVQATFEGWERVTVSDWEMQQADTSYTYKTLQYLKSQYSEHQWHIVVGADTYQHLSLWKEITWIRTQANFWVLPRQGKGNVTLEESDTMLDVQLPEVSSTQIRESNDGLQWIPEEARPYYPTMRK